MLPCEVQLWEHSLLYYSYYFIPICYHTNVKHQDCRHSYFSLVCLMLFFMHTILELEHRNLFYWDIFRNVSLMHQHSQYIFTSMFLILIYSNVTQELRCVLRTIDFRLSFKSIIYTSTSLACNICLSYM